MSNIDIAILGGGAAGFFAALTAKETYPHCSVSLFEKSAVYLSKVKVSGGGRCNVTHACFDPAKLVQNYPRGGQELLGPFHRFQPQDTIAWFERRGVKLKTETDGRMFPTTDSSQTIIDTFLHEARRLNVALHSRQQIVTVSHHDNLFHLLLRDGTHHTCKALILATGSNPEGHQFAEYLGHTIIPPVPSLFTFNVPTSRLTHLSGVAVPQATVSLPQFSMKQTGPLLITHFGFSGPAVLKLSAWAARELHSVHYKTEIQINWTGTLTHEQIKKAQFNLPKNLWKTLIYPHTEKTLAHLSRADLEKLAQTFQADTYQMEGKTTHKEEFVTCGGVLLKEVDFKTMQSKKVPHLYFAGEILNIDGITGGFNFQNAWTTGYLAGASCGSLPSHHTTS